MLSRFLLLSLALFVQPLSGATTAPPKKPDWFDGWAATMVPSKIVTYKQVGDRELKLHVFDPKGTLRNDLRPCFVAIHGGGWQGGEPQRFYPIASHFSDLGMVGVSVQYRLIQKDGSLNVYDCVKDVRSALRYLKKHAIELGIDPGRIVVSGGSAGGHLAAATALFDDVNAPADDLSVDPTPYALILYFPVIDTSADGYGQTKIGDTWEELSPLHHVHPGLPPTLVLHGTGDKTTPFQGAVAFTKAMKLAGNRCELISHEEGPHGYFIKTRTLFDQAMNQSEAFLRSLDLLP